MIHASTLASHRYVIPELPPKWTYSASTRTDKIAVSSVYDVTAEHVTVEGAVRSLQEITLQAFDEFAEMIQAIPTVEAVQGQAAGTYLHLVTYASQSLEEERNQVYDTELRIAARYPQLEFEFDLVDRRGYPGIWVETAADYQTVFRVLPNTEDEHGDARH